MIESFEKAIACRYRIGIARREVLPRLTSFSGCERAIGKVWWPTPVRGIITVLFVRHVSFLNSKASFKTYGSLTYRARDSSPEPEL